MARSRTLALAALLVAPSCAGRQAPSARVAVITSANGQVTRVSMRNGRRHGGYELVHSNGQIAVRGAYANGMRHGVFSYWNEDGSLRSRHYYERDKKIWDSASGRPAPALAVLQPIRPAPPPRHPTVVTFEAHGVAGGNRTAERVDLPARPSARFGVGGALLVRSGLLHAGAVADWVPSDTQLYHAYFGGLIGLRRRLPWAFDLALESAVELGGHRVGGIGEGPYFDVSPESRWVPYVGLRSGAALPITARLSISAQVGVRIDRGRDAFTLVEAQNPVGETTFSIQDWEVGGRTLFALAGLRLTVR